MNGNEKTYYETIRAGLRAQIVTKEAEIQGLKSQIAQLDGFEKQRLALPLHAKDKYKNFALTDAVIDAVKALCVTQPQGVTAIEITRFLQEHGFVVITKNFYITVHVTVGRLSALNCSSTGNLAVKLNKPIVAEIGSGRRRYKPNKEFRGTDGGLAGLKP